MNTVQVAERLRDLPLSILPSEDIVTILKIVNDVVPTEVQITASSLGDDIYKLFRNQGAEVQTQMLKEVFSLKREAIILRTILEESTKQSRSDKTMGSKWTGIQASITLIGMGVLLAITWSFVSTHATKPIVPDAVIGNIVTELVHSGTRAIIRSVEQDQEQATP